MKTNSKQLSSDYLRALQHFAAAGTVSRLKGARRLGEQSSSLGMEISQIANIHQNAASRMKQPGGRSERFYSARLHEFFVTALVANTETRRTAETLAWTNGAAQLTRDIHALVATNLKLKEKLARGLVTENKLITALRQKRVLHQSLLEEARVAQRQLRHLSHNLINAQEEERKEISRELHDDIAQTLAGISVHLAALKEAASINTLALRKKIDRTQVFVARSVKIVHRFARELRPTLLDDLGLTPALRSYIDLFSQRTGLRVDFDTTPAADQLNSVKRTVFYRVAQEALTNVSRHAQASRAKVTLARQGETLRMEIKDDGHAFDVQQTLSGRRNQRLGLIGMRERVEMTGGRFSVTSTPGEGTTVVAQLPLNGHANMDPPAYSTANDT